MARTLAALYCLICLVKISSVKMSIVWHLLIVMLMTFDDVIILDAKWLDQLADAVW